MLVSRRTGRLNNENIVSPNVFLDPNVRLAIGERADRRLTERTPMYLQIRSASSRLAEPVKTFNSG